MEAREARLRATFADALALPVRKRVAATKNHTGLGRLQKQTPKAPQDLKLASDAVRGTLMAMERASGATLGELASKYQVNYRTVVKQIDLAQQAGLFDHYRQGILNHLIPKAIALYEMRLDAGDLEAAKEVLFGIGLLQKDAKPPSVSSGDQIESLEVYRLRRQGGGFPPAPPPVTISITPEES